MSIVVVDYDMGNVGSIVNMMKKIGHPVKLSRDPEEIRAAARLILPGVGAFDAGMARIRSLGLLEVLTRQVMDLRTPILGICLGMQLLGERSDEGTSTGLGWIRAESVRLPSDQLRVPHMGWNTVLPVRQGEQPAHWLFAGLPEDMRFYFVHSYHVVCRDPADRIAACQYGQPVTAAMAREHIVGVQFHPEKSHRFGMQVLRNFASHPAC